MLWLYSMLLQHFSWKKNAPKFGTIVFFVLFCQKTFWFFSWWKQNRHNLLNVVSVFFLKGILVNKGRWLESKIAPQKSKQETHVSIWHCSSLNFRATVLYLGKVQFSFLKKLQLPLPKEKKRKNQDTTTYNEYIKMVSP